MVSGSLYSILINVADGETKKKLQTLDHFFNFDTLLAAAGRAVHNLFVVVLGRFVFDLVVYGPKVTLESAAKMSVDEILALPFRPNVIRIFTGRAVVEGLGLVVGWMLYSVIASVFNRPEDRRRRSVVPMDVDDVPAFIETNFERILRAIDQ